ncbi:hypothetical protein PoB_002125200 [Plakobranchus ocellatus]|uniref:Uncharacterized protein n=1 Tax=Plakobranchus ocellatus TaxID=259542 RepID=A0AAV3ZJN1_9GAST|nr:hypothetical protein PoB_002125200 [Plakobranchus ocellatus]
MSAPKVDLRHYNNDYQRTLDTTRDAPITKSSSNPNVDTLHQCRNLSENQVYHLTPEAQFRPRGVQCSIANRFCQRFGGHDSSRKIISQFHGTSFPLSSDRILHPLHLLPQLSPSASDSAYNTSNIASNTLGTTDRITQTNNYDPQLLTPNKPDAASAPSLAYAMATIGVAYFWVGPLIVVFWYNTWHLTELYVFSDHTEVSTWTCAVFGYSILTLASCFQAKLSTLVSAIAIQELRYLMSLVYTYVLALACVSQWRGLWALEDVYLGVTVTGVATSAGVAAILLLLLRCYQSTVGAPAVVKPDSPLDSYFTFSTYFGMKSNSLSLVWDSLFTVLLTASFVITVWRGVWESMDLHFFPKNATKTGLLSLVISYGLMIVLSLCQDKVSQLSAYLDKVHWLLKLILEDFVYIVQSIICITYLRGFWVLLNEYDLYRPWSLWVCHVTSYLLLTASKTAQNLVVFTIIVCLDRIVFLIATKTRLRVYY